MPDANLEDGHPLSALQQAESFWRQMLSGLRAQGRLGTAVPIPGRGGCGEHTVELPAAVTTALTSLARYGRFSIEAMVECAWAVALAHRTGTRDVLFGITVPPAEAAEGPLTVPLRVAVEPETPLLTLLRRVQDLQTAIRPHAAIPLSQIHAWSPVATNAPLLHSRITFEKQPESQLSQTPLSLAVRPGAELALTLSYDRERFMDMEARVLLEHVKALLESFAADPLQQLGDLDGIARTVVQPQKPAPPAPVIASRPAAEAVPEPKETQANLELMAVPRDQPLPATFYQEWALQLDGVETNSLPSALAIEGPIDFTALRRTLTEISRRQDA